MICKQKNDIKLKDYGKSTLYLSFHYYLMGRNNHNGPTKTPE